MKTIRLDHTISTGHRIVGHEGKCARLHGHDYRFHVELASDVLLPIGFVIDFADVKGVLDEWDHRLLLWTEDPLWVATNRTQSATFPHDLCVDGEAGVIRVAFNPTAENMADHLVKRYLEDFDQIVYAAVEVWETPKASAFAEATR